MRKSNFQFCIICGNSFSDNVVPSKEHIIPEALGNKKLVTYSVCRTCNNNLGSNVDCYLTDFLFARIVRKANLCKDKDLRIFDSIMTDDKGNDYRITDDGPQIKPDVKIDKDIGHIHMEVATVEEGLKIARKILKSRFKKNSAEIEEILKDPSRFMKGEAQFLYVGTFTQNFTIDFTRLKLAAIKIAYEFASEKLGEEYAVDNDAVILRAYLKSGCDGYKQFTKEKCKEIDQRCHCIDSFTEIIDNMADAFSIMSVGRKMVYIMYLHPDGGDNLICNIRILDSSLLSFTVFLSKNASRYLVGKRDYLSCVLDDGELIEL